jgi:hypothetical protein
MGPILSKCARVWFDNVEACHVKEQPIPMEHILLPGLVEEAEQKPV